MIKSSGVVTLMLSYAPMMIFTGFGVLALLFAYLLKAEDNKKGYGLQLPNIQK